MFEIVFREYGDGTVGGEASIEERLADAADGCIDLSVREVAPVAVVVALRVHEFVWRLP